MIYVTKVHHLTMVNYGEVETILSLRNASPKHGWASLVAHKQLRIHLQCRRPRFDPESGRSPGEGDDNPLQYVCLENSTDIGA